MFKHPIYRVRVQDDPATEFVLVGEFDEIEPAFDYFTQAVEAHIEKIEKGSARVVLIAE